MEHNPQLQGIVAAPNATQQDKLEVNEGGSVSPNERLSFTVPEARVMLHLSDSTIRRFLMSGRLVGYQVGTHWRIGRDEILRFAAQGPLKIAKQGKLEGSS